MSESSKTWIPLKKELDKCGYKGCYDRFENNIGRPDLVIYVEKQKRDIWIELKYCDAVESMDSEIDIGLRKEQFIWMRNAYSVGRSVILLARVGDLWCIWNDVDSWEMAKKSSSWSRLYRKALHSTHPRAVVDLLENCCFTK